MRINSNKAALYIGVILCAFIALSCCLLGVRQVISGYETHSWSSVEGEVIESDIVTDSWHGQKGGNRMTYSPKVKYRYKVRGKVFENDVIANYALGSKDQRDVQEYVSKYLTGQPVAVFYNPLSPSKSVLEPGGSLKSWGIILVGIVFLGFMSCLFSLRKNPVFG